ncbi:MAG: protein-L-isoaspartate(D-aspartate) O-methyltransferase [Nitrospirales bacterium]|nr:protein-L-isoaspartate(D-aspartate) O-methyltransferase [Nitrospira sp.]MDR4502537.1 protein-L-isoaspartate(D-aspartate) O-methyltransferase [Nitrospirales bacterium]
MSLWHAQTSMSRPPERQVERDRMVDEQIVARGIKSETVTSAMRQVPRHRFVLSSHQLEAYEDYPLSIDYHQTISQPYIVALMTEALALESKSKVLEIGTGCGYQTAVLAHIVDRVFTIEIVAPLARRADSILHELQFDNISVRVGDGYQGWPEEGPFDAIILTAAPESVPDPLLEQLQIGGRFILPLGGTSQTLVLFHRTERGLVQRQILAVSFVPMTGQAQTGSSSNRNNDPP